MRCARIDLAAGGSDGGRGAVACPSAPATIRAVVPRLRIAGRCTMKAGERCMYDLIRVLHSVNRWVVIVVLVVALARGIAGWRAKAAWTDGDRRLGKLVSGVADLQMAL